MPNFNYKSVWQDQPNTVGASIAGSLPNITGQVGRFNALDNSNASGCFGRIQYNAGGGYHALTVTNDIDFNAARSSSIYQDGQTQVVPAANIVLFCIRY